ncbi:hypothetical protein IQ06DRAFT_347986 [Phaeosphaeriaceae sp. SRC1lsM3a]|nr:hypothetical protein IQ06DRAFT_347986 [Stagonospora sp. SRC1lsM3a]
MSTHKTQSKQAPKAKTYIASLLDDINKDSISLLQSASKLSGARMLPRASTSVPSFPDSATGDSQRAATASPGTASTVSSTTIAPTSSDVSGEHRAAAAALPSPPENHELTVSLEQGSLDHDRATPRPTSKATSREINQYPYPDSSGPPEERYNNTAMLSRSLKSHEPRASLNYGASNTDRTAPPAITAASSRESCRPASTNHSRLLQEGRYTAHPLGFTSSSEDGECSPPHSSRSPTPAGGSYRPVAGSRAPRDDLRSHPVDDASDRRTYSSRLAAPRRREADTYRPQEHAQEDLPRPGTASRYSTWSQDRLLRELSLRRLQFVRHEPSYLSELLEICDGHFFDVRNDLEHMSVKELFSKADTHNILVDKDKYWARSALLVEIAQESARLDVRMHNKRQRGERVAQEVAQNLTADMNQLQRRKVDRPKRIQRGPKGRPLLGKYIKKQNVDAVGPEETSICVPEVASKRASTQASSKSKKNKKVDAKGDDRRDSGYHSSLSKSPASVSRPTTGSKAHSKMSISSAARKDSPSRVNDEASKNLGQSKKRTHPTKDQDQDENEKAPKKTKLARPEIVQNVKKSSAPAADVSIDAYTVSSERKKLTPRKPAVPSPAPAYSRKRKPVAYEDSSSDDDIPLMQLRAAKKQKAKQPVTNDGVSNHSTHASLEEINDVAAKTKAESKSSVAKKKPRGIPAEERVKGVAYIKCDDGTYLKQERKTKVGTAKPKPKPKIPNYNFVKY